MDETQKDYTEKAKPLIERLEELRAQMETAVQESGLKDFALITGWGQAMTDDPQYSAYHTSYLTGHEAVLASTILSMLLLNENVRLIFYSLLGSVAAELGADDGTDSKNALS